MKKRFKTSELSSYLENMKYSDCIWDKWFLRDDIFKIDIKSGEYTIKAIPVSIVLGLRTIDELKSFNEKPYIYSDIKDKSATEMETIESHMRNYSTYLEDNYETEKNKYICWIYKNDFLIEIGEDTFKNIQKQFLERV